MSEDRELDLYDDKVQEGIGWAMRQWGEALGLTTWTQGDGSESVEGDVGAEIHTILVDAGLRDPETNAMATLARPPAIGVEAVARDRVMAVLNYWFDGTRRIDPESEMVAQLAALAALPSVPVGGLGASLRDTHRAADAAVLADAERFRALMRCGRIKMQGSSGVDAKTGERNGNSVHFGAEFWPDPPKPEYAHLDGGEPSTFWGRACLRALADAILEREAASGAVGTSAASAPSLPTEDAAGGFCGCNRCVEEAVEADGGGPFDTRLIRMFLCSICGNKRCPHAADHRNTCTNSNEPGQPGSSYPAAPTTPASLEGGD